MRRFMSFFFSTQKTAYERRISDEFRRVLFRSLAVDAGDALHEWARQLVLGVAGPVHQARRNTGKLAVAVGLGELLGAEIDAIELPLGGTVAQHEVRAVEVELMGRHVDRKSTRLNTSH